MKRLLTTVVLVGLLASVGQAAEVKFALTGANTKLTFVGTKPGGKHDGGFKALTGSAVMDGTDAATLKITADIDMNSIYTDTDKLTAHLKSPDFFSVKNNPKAKFATTKIEKGDDGYHVTGKLTIAGKSHDVTFPATIAVSGTSLSLASTFKINRNDWGISYGPGKINDEVTLTLAVNAKK